MNESKCMTEDELDEIMRDYVPLAEKEANDFHGREKAKGHILPMEELEQAALHGVLDAIQRYDESKGASFLTYMRIRINGKMMDFRREFYGTRSISPPSKTFSLNTKVIRDEFAELIDLLEYQSSEYELIDFFIDKSDEEDYLLKKRKQWALDSIKSEKERIVLQYLLSGYNLKEIGKKVGKSESRVCQIKKAIMKHLKSVFAEEMEKYG